MSEGGSAERSGAGSRAAEGAGAGGAGPRGAAAEGATRHPRSFKLRFGAHREPGRSYVSLVKPLGLPATVTDKFYARERAEHVAPAAEARALAAIRRMFSREPRAVHPAPLTSAHEYGWEWRAGAARAAAERADRRRSHHIVDSAWMKARLRLLAADDHFRRN